MRFDTLPEWLAWQENLHFTEVDPGLERVGKVWQQLNNGSVLPFKVITVAGTNGKGSSVAMLDEILRAAGYRTGRYTSPHLLHYNERIVIGGHACEDEAICQAFEKIDFAREKVSLTYFEFSTLAAVTLFCEQAIDIAILEVGMGGRLDAVNIFDADIALITPISLDHVQWLGHDRNTIGFEKAGIIRSHTPVVCSEDTPPDSVIAHAKQLNAALYIGNTDFHVHFDTDSWQWSNSTVSWHDLPYPALSGRYQVQNASAVLQVISLLNLQGLTITHQHVAQGLRDVKLMGRFQQLDGPVTRILDVTHNQHGAVNLAELLRTTPCEGKTIVVLGMLKDKEVTVVVETLKPFVDLWHIAGLASNRGLSAEALAVQLTGIIATDRVATFETVALAYTQAMEIAVMGDRVLIFGSFQTVEAVLRLGLASELLS